MYDSSDALGAGSYPTPPEYEQTSIEGEITLTFKFEDMVPNSWSREDIINNIKENLTDYVDLHDYEEIDIEL